MSSEICCRLLLALMLMGSIVDVSWACPLNCTCDLKEKGKTKWGSSKSRARRLVVCSGESLTSPIPADLLPRDTVMLDLSENGITTLHAGDFADLGSIQMLNLSHNQISYIEPRAFEGLSSVMVLDLSYNRLGSVNNSMFIGLSSLEELIFSFNQISTIAEASFDRLLALRKLDFQSEYLVCDCKLEWMVKWKKSKRVKIASTTTCAIPNSLRGREVSDLKRNQLHCDFPLELPQFEIIPSSDQVVFQGDPVSLECIATYLDETQRLVWLRNNKILQTNASAGITIDTQIQEDQSVMKSTLTVQQIQETKSLWKMECRVLTERGRGNRNVGVNLYVFSNFNQSENCRDETTTSNKGTFHWPVTISTMTAELPCPHGGGQQFMGGGDPTQAVARRQCSDEGHWLPPQTGVCQFEDETTRTLARIAWTIYTNVSVALTAARQVEIQTGDAHTFTDEVNIMFIGRFMEQIRQFTTRELGQVMINIASNLMEANATLLATSQLLEKSCSKIVTTLEHFASNILHSGPGIDIDLYAPNIALRAIKMGSKNTFNGMLCAAFVPGPGQRDDFTRQNVKCHMSNVTSAQLDVTMGPIQTSIQLPASIFQGLTPGQRSTSGHPTSRPGLVLQFLVYQNGRLFPALKTSPEGDLVISDRAVTSMVVASKIENYNVVNLTDPVTLTFEPSTEGYSAMPAYWDFSARDHFGEWKSEGCAIVLETDNMTTVQCNHLTNFAILKDFSDPHEKYIGGFWPIGSLHPAIYIGSFILLVLLFITLLTYVCFHSNIRMKRNCRHSLINICLAVMLLVVFYAGGVRWTDPPLLCQIVGVGLHYFTVCTLMWMVIQANNLRKSGARRSRPPLPPGETPPPPRPILRFYFVGWGIPMIIVGITAAASPGIGNYGGTEFCWIVDFKVSLVAFFAIAAAMVILTCALFVWASMHINSAPSLAQLQAYESREQTSTEPKEGAGRNHHPHPHQGENGGSERQPATDNESVVTHRTGVSGLSSVMDSEYTYPKQITAAVLMLLGFVGTWMFGALAVTQEDILEMMFCYLYGGMALVLGLFVFVYNCGMRNDVKYNWRRTCGCVGKDQYTVAVTSNQVSMPTTNGHVVQRRQSASSVDSNATNRSNNTNHSFPSVVSGSRKATSKCNYVPSHTNTGTDASVDSSTQDNAGRVHGNDKHRSNGYAHRYHKQGRSRNKNHKHSRYSQLSRDGQDGMVAGAPQMMPGVGMPGVRMGNGMGGGAGRTGSSSSFPISHMQHTADPAMHHSPASSNPSLPHPHSHHHHQQHHAHPQHPGPYPLGPMGSLASSSQPRMVPLNQDLHSSHSGLGINSQPEALCTTQSWDALRENSLPRSTRSTASSERFSRPDRTGYVHHYIDCPPEGSIPRSSSGKRQQSELRRVPSKNSSRDRLPPRHEDIAEYPTVELNPLLSSGQRANGDQAPPHYEELCALPEQEALIGHNNHMNGEESANSRDSDNSRALISKEFQVSQSTLSGDKRETSV